MELRFAYRYITETVRYEVYRLYFLNYQKYIDKKVYKYNKSEKVDKCL